MGRFSDSGLAKGTSGSGQMSIEQLEYALAADRAEAELERIAEKAQIDSMLDELDSNGAK